MAHTHKLSPMIYGWDVYIECLEKVCARDDIINPRRACAARVTVLSLSVLPSVCPVPLILALRATRRPKSATNGFSATLA